MQAGKGAVLELFVSNVSVLLKKDLYSFMKWTITK